MQSSSMPLTLSEAATLRVKAASESGRRHETTVLRLMSISLRAQRRISSFRLTYTDEHARISSAYTVHVRVAKTIVETQRWIKTA